MKKIADYIMKFFIFLSFGLAILALVRPELIKDFIEWIRSWVDLLWNWNYIIVFTSAVIESFPVLGVIIPGQNILLIAWGFFAEQSTQKLIYTVVTASIWAIAWNFFGYWLWKRYGEWFFKQYGLWFGIGETEVAYMKKWIEKWGPLWVTLGKFHNLARAFVPFIAWSMGMKSGKFMLYNAIGSIARAVTIVLLWVLFADNYEIFIDYLEYFFIGIFIIIALYIYFFKRTEFKVYWKQKNAEIEEKMNSRS